MGGIIALLGVIVLPITSGDTALRSLRLSISDSLHIDQSSKPKRLGLSAIIFALVAVILVFAKSSPSGFNTLWRYFAWFNQTLAVFTLWAVTVYLIKKGKNYWVSLIPAVVMTFVCSTYLLVGKEMFHLGRTISFTVGSIITLLIVFIFIYWKRRNDKAAA